MKDCNETATHLVIENTEKWVPRRLTSPRGMQVTCPTKSQTCRQRFARSANAPSPGGRSGRRSGIRFNTVLRPARPNQNKRMKQGRVSLLKTPKTRCVLVSGLFALPRVDFISSSKAGKHWSSTTSGTQKCSPVPPAVLVSGPCGALGFRLLIKSAISYPFFETSKISPL